MPFRRLRLGLTIAVALIAAGCSGTQPSAPDPPTATPIPTATPTPTPAPPTPEEILERSGRAMQSLRTFNFRLYHDVGSLDIAPGLSVSKANGKVVNPDKLSVEFSVSLGDGLAIKSEVITIGDQTYMTNPFSGRWEASDSNVSPVGFFSPTRGISEMMSQVQEASLDYPNTSDAVYAMKGKLPSESLASLLGQTLTGATVDIDLKVDKASDYLLEARFVGAVTPSDVENAERVIVLSFFNEDIVIEAPDDSS